MLSTAASSFNHPTGSWTDFVSPDPSSKFPAEKGRYHLYAALFCPFAHRALLLRELKGLQDVISISIVHWFKGVKENGKYPGWHFETAEDTPGCIPDPLYNSKMLSEIYFKADPRYDSVYSVPVLWDKKTETIVNNESDQIMRMLSTAFDEFVPPERKGMTYCPKSLKSQIEDISQWMQSDVNTGVYKAGFAGSQEQYEKAIGPLSSSLDKLEDMLDSSNGPFLLGSKMTELDIRLYATLIRFDVVYLTHFKTNLKSVRHDYPKLHLWLKMLYHKVPGFKETTDFEHIKKNYFVSHKDINPHGIVPVGPLPPIEDLKPEDDGGWKMEGWEGTKEE